jgi:hypothetical protein
MAYALSAMAGSLGTREGEKWGFAVFRKRADAVKAIQAGERFGFAGGQCLEEDVELVYLGSGNAEYSRAADSILSNRTRGATAQST